MFIGAAILATLLAPAFLAAGIPKVTGQAKMIAQADHLRVPYRVYRGIGVLEALGAVGVAVGLWSAWLGVSAGGGLALLMVGAVPAHLRAKDQRKAIAPAFVLGLLAVAYVVVRAATA